MLDRMLKAQTFKHVRALFDEGNVEKATALLEDLQAEYVSLCEENKDLKSQLAEVAEVLDMAENMEFDGQKYWVVEDGERRGPFCQLCYDRDGLLIRLQEKSKQLLCHGCGSHYPRPKAPKEEPAASADENRVIPMFAE